MPDLITQEASKPSSDLHDSVQQLQDVGLTVEKRKGLLSQAKDVAKLLLTAKVSNSWNQIVESQIDVAKGIFEEKEVTDPSDHSKKIMKVYKRPPNVEAGRYLIDQVVGKPIETVENQQTITLIVDK